MAIQKIYATEANFPYQYVTVRKQCHAIYRVVFIVGKYFFEQYINLRQMRLLQVRQVPQHISALGITQQQFKRNQKRDYDKL